MWKLTMPLILIPLAIGILSFIGAIALDMKMLATIAGLCIVACGLLWLLKEW